MDLISRTCTVYRVHTRKVLCITHNPHMTDTDCEDDRPLAQAQDTLVLCYRPSESTGEPVTFFSVDVHPLDGRTFVVTTAPDPSRPGHYVWSSSSRARNGEVGDQDVMLEYTADLAEGVHSLDVEQSIDTLSCSADHIVVGVTSDEALRGWGQSFVVVADRRWGCDEGTVVRQVTAVHWLSPTSARLSTQPSSYAHVFANASVHLSAAASSSQPQPLVARGPRRATAAMGDPRAAERAQNGVVVRSPAVGDLYSTGDVITVEWIAPYVEGYSWTLYFYESGAVRFSVVDIPAETRKAALWLSDMPSSSRWSVYVGYNCGFLDCAFHGESDKFSINFEPAIGFVRPASGELFSEGGDVRVQWTYRSDLVGQIVVVSLWRWIDMWPDTLVGQRTIVIISGGPLTWTVGTNWVDSDRYYA
eukprot:m51a1_g11430 hypothetical protein (417) ;mRNA; f:17794-20555